MDEGMTTNNAKEALLVIDVQNEYFTGHLPMTFPEGIMEKWLRTGGVSRIAICGYMAQMCCDTTARQSFHLGFQVDFLSDAVGTLAVQNSAGAISATDLHRAVMVTQAMLFARVMKTEEWIRAMVEGRFSRRVG